MRLTRPLIVAALAAGACAPPAAAQTAGDIPRRNLATGLGAAPFANADRIRALARRGLVTAPGGVRLRSANIVLDCPALAWTGKVPRGRGPGKLFIPADANG